MGFPVYSVDTFVDTNRSASTKRLWTLIGAYLPVDKMFSAYFLGRPRTSREVGLFADAELAEDEVQDVIVCSGAGESIKGIESFIKVEENHLVGDDSDDGLLCPAERSKRGRNRLLLAEICEESAFCTRSFLYEARKDGATKFWDTGSCQGRRFEDGVRTWLHWVRSSDEIALIDNNEERAAA